MRCIGVPADLPHHHSRCSLSHFLPSSGIDRHHSDFTSDLTAIVINSLMFAGKRGHTLLLQYIRTVTSLQPSQNLVTILNSLRKVSTSPTSSASCETTYPKVQRRAIKHGPRRLALTSLAPSSHSGGSDTTEREMSPSSGPANVGPLSVAPKFASLNRQPKWDSYQGQVSVRLQQHHPGASVYVTGQDVVAV